MAMMQDVILVGAGGHGKVVLDSLTYSDQYQVIGATDILAESNQFDVVKMLGDDSVIEKWLPDQIYLANGIGFLPKQNQRKNIYQRFKQQTYSFITIAHPTAIISTSAQLHEGVQVFAGSIIQAVAEIGENSIINSGVIIEHDVKIGAHAHVAPGAIICGGVNIGEGVFVGAGARIIQGINIGKGSIIAAGAIVTRNVEDGEIVIGTSRGRDHG